MATASSCVAARLRDEGRGRRGGSGAAARARGKARAAAQASGGGAAARRRRSSGEMQSAAAAAGGEERQAGPEAALFKGGRCQAWRRGKGRRARPGLGGGGGVGHARDFVLSSETGASALGWAGLARLAGPAQFGGFSFF